MSDTRRSYADDPLAANAQVIAQYRATGGQLSPPFHGERILLLTTTGARSGLQHTAPLGFVRDGDPDRLVVFASNVASPRTPAWCLNLRRHPEATVEVGRDRFAVRATVVDSGPERDRLYELFTSQMPGTASHQDRTQRVIPMVVLERLR